MVSIITVVSEKLYIRVYETFFNYLFSSSDNNPPLQTVWTQIRTEKTSGLSCLHTVDTKRVYACT